MIPEPQTHETKENLISQLSSMSEFIGSDHTGLDQLVAVMPCLKTWMTSTIRIDKPLKLNIPKQVADCQLPCLKKLWLEQELIFIEGLWRIDMPLLE